MASTARRRRQLQARVRQHGLGAPHRSVQRYHRENRHKASDNENDKPSKVSAALGLDVLSRPDWPPPAQIGTAVLDHLGPGIDGSNPDAQEDDASEPNNRCARGCAHGDRAA